MKQIDLVQKFRSGDRTVKGPKDTKDIKGYINNIKSLASV